MRKDRLSRRNFFQDLALGATMWPPSGTLSKVPFHLRYAISSAMYGNIDIAKIISELPRTGAEFLDLWCRPWVNHRDELDTMGTRNFVALLARHDLKLGVVTRYDVSPSCLRQETRVMAKLGGKVIISGSPNTGRLEAEDLKSAVQKFVEQIRPVAVAAESRGITVAIENHPLLLLGSTDAMKWFNELAPLEGLGIALALFHLGRDPAMMAELIKDLGPRIAFIYAWQQPTWLGHKKPSTKEVFDQLPGRGPMDFKPIVAALRQIEFGGFVSIFMESLRGYVPIWQTPEEVTEEIIEARQYLDRCLSEV
jgi:sugar phosphate isomerase/epimerase